ncbi:MAG TPA: ABC transporter permease [Flavisolibacter sp.]|jgi:ABC-type antimicrobial peptide transport system permease subunit|nr:ABC transporter permease [Flavisolibacter sp.]
MLLHNLKQIWRGLWRYKGFTLINFLGLAIGIAAIVLLFLIATYEKGFDRLHTGEDKIYRVFRTQERDGKKEDEATMPYPTAKFFRSEYPGALATQIHFDRDRNIKAGDKMPFSEKNIVFADSLFFKVMDYSSIDHFWIKGNPDKAMEAPNSAVLTESTAKRYFGTEDPIGKTFRLDNKVDIQVVGLVKDIPATTHLPVNLFISFATLNSSLMSGLDINEWGFTSNGYCYIKVPDEPTKAGIGAALNRIVQSHAETETDKKERLGLQPVSEIHFDPRFDNSNPNYTVSRQYLKMLLLLGAFIILIACVNYVNLATSLAFSKAKEVGIRKTIGASKPQLFSLYLMETIVLTTLAALCGVLIALLVLPSINQLLDKSISAHLMLNARSLTLAVGGILVISLLSGAYPALILSGFNPIVSLKNQLHLPGRGSALVRKGLVVFQFTTSIALIICTLVISRQVHYFNSKQVGFNKSGVVEVSLPVSDSAKIEGFKSLLQNQSGVEVVTFCIGAPITDNNISTSLKAPELPAGSDYNIKVIACDENYLKTYGMKLLAGRWFLPGEMKKEGAAIVINEATMRTLGYKQPSEVIGRQIQVGINDMNPVIIGVTQDFHTTSLHKAIANVGMTPFPPFYYAAGIRVSPNSMKNTLAAIESQWRKVYTDDVYQMKFIDETLARRYEQETRDYELFKAFSAISIFICCIGLWGLIAFVVVRRTKEIGIRKVLGASITHIVGLISKEFLLLVAVALVVASPIAWYFMHQWLENFAYRIDIGWWIFALAGLFALTIALITISFQAVKAALSNPIKNLRTE